MRKADLVGILVSVSGLAGASDLVDAIKDQDHKTIVTLLQHDSDVNATMPDGSTPLAWAAYEDDTATVEMLLKAGARVNVPNEYGETPLTLACAIEDVAMVQKLLNAGADPNMAREAGEPPLMIASALGNPRLVEMLVERGSKVDAAESRKGQNALMWAAANGHSEVVDILLKASANPNNSSKTGFTPLMFASAKGDTRIVTHLLAAGAKVNQSAVDGTNALMIAVHSRRLGATKALILRGGNVFTLGGVLSEMLDHAWEQLSERDDVKRFIARSFVIELGLAGLGLTLAILLVVLGKTGRLKRVIRPRWLMLSALLALPLALANPLVWEGSSARRWLVRAAMLSIVVFSYRATAAYLSGIQSIRARTGEG